ncbi:MAG: glycine cleavage system aminomethyltransferase GcvT [Rhodospirillaceae bacterium]|nr:glycine cleavage system aminomethyltransferase GcvT [Rhodospirillaceae bacterium]
MAETESDLKQTVLADRHAAAGARFVPFAGYRMPIQYDPKRGGGIVEEHRWTRTQASLFDVSHMGIVDIVGADAGQALERLLPAALADQPLGSQRYSFLLNQTGGIIDDLMVTRLEDNLWRLVINAANRAADLAWLTRNLDPGVAVQPRDDLSLVALQGPAAGAVLAGIDPAVDALYFMQAGTATLAGTACALTRSGYTGEDGFELALPVDRAGAIADLLLADERVRWAGLGARDTLRLEAGLCLHGHDIGPEVTPVEAALTWAIPKRRRAGQEFIGAQPVYRQIQDGAAIRLVGLRPEGRAPVREETDLFDAAGADAGTVTSGSFSPMLEAPIALALVKADLAKPDMVLTARVRGRDIPCRVAPLPFVPHRYRRRTT